MSLLTSVITGPKQRPRRLLLYGTHGVGKSTFATHAPSPIFLCTESGADDLAVPRTPLLTSYGDVMTWMSDLITTPDHGYHTVVVDTADWLERLIWQHVCEADGKGKTNIEDFGFGKGYVIALKTWHHFIGCCDSLIKRGCNVVLLAHAQSQRHSPPGLDPYDRYTPAVHKSAAAKLMEWCDECFFAAYDTSTTVVDDGFNRERTKAIGGDRRVLHTCETPHHLAKRRLKLADVIELTEDATAWRAYRAAWPKGAGDIAGKVKDGSSKKKG